MPAVTQDTNPLWLFANQVWRNQAVQTILLSLQDDYACRINPLIYAIYLGVKGVKVNEANDQLNSSTLNWYQESILPYRSLRVRLKQEGKTLWASYALKAELAAEKAELFSLYQLKAGKQTTSPPHLTVLHNLQQLTQLNIERVPEEILVTLTSAALSSILTSASKTEGNYQ